MPGAKSASLLTLWDHLLTTIIYSFDNKPVRYRTIITPMLEEVWTDG